MTAHAARIASSPVQVTLGDLVRLRPAGESLKLTAPRIRVAIEGGHVSPYKGRGVEFDESRPYQPGDDLRTMDWRVTARTGKPHTKVFREERNRPVFVWLDLRRPMLFATRGAYKGVRAAEAALKLLQLVCTDSFWRPPATAETLETDAERALQRLTRVARPGSLIFLVSDFRRLGADYERQLRQLALHCDLLLVHCYDAVEAELPPPGRYRIQGVGRSFSIETANEATRRRYHERFAARRAALEALCRTPGIRMVDCATDADPRSVLNQKFRSR